ncbi:MAG: hypothetical protein K2Q01_11640, partial [Rickettsiales bacterium]|nr:hypothetical protein [Rickettsiales bacterium]
MLSTTYIAYAIASVGIFTVYMAAMHVFRSSTLKQKVNNVAEPGFGGTEEDEAPSALAEAARQVLHYFKIDASGQRELNTALTRAGFTSPHATTYYLFARYALQPFALLIAIHLTYKAFFVPDRTVSHMLSYLLMAAIATLIGLRGAQIFVQNSKAKRHQALMDSFPEMLDLMLVCIES